MMKKASTKGYVILGFLFAVISVIAFATPTVKMGTFWITYAFTIAAFAVQPMVWNAAFGNGNALKSKFLGFPIVHISIVYLMLQLIAFAVFMFASTLPVWSSIAVCTVIAGASAVCIVSADAGRGEIERVEAKVQKKVLYIRELQGDIELLADSETDAETKAELIRLAEKIRYSDPMSNECLTDLEDRIVAAMAELKKAISKKKIIVELNSLWDERNKKCKLLKQSRR